MQTDIVLELTGAHKVNYVLDNQTFHKSNYAEPNVCLGFTAPLDCNENGNHILQEKTLRSHK